MVLSIKEQEQKQKARVMFSDYKANLKTEDDYCETLTASSDDSPERGAS
jgi:predicted phosphoadenosine phosphosulfate sulfurtransferase